MNLENILDMADVIQKQKDLEQELFEEKLKELRKYQEETVLRKDKMRDELFPEKLQCLIRKIKGDNSIAIGDNHDIRCFFHQEGVKFSVRINNTRCVLRLDYNNEYDEIFDWWANEPYRKSHMVKRIKLLNNENKICSIIENNIEHIYRAISKVVEEYQKESLERTASDLTELNKVTIKKNKFIKIIIEFEE